MNNAEIGSQEKQTAALKSVTGAIFLTTMKIVVGIASGSLGILAEAAHSALDLVSAVVAFLAVRFAGKPADKDHAYGHGKIENLAALSETILLFVTCLWIGYESIHRLMSPRVNIDASVWAFGVMIISIVVDVSRSRMLFAVAKKYRSQALEADAIHFSTDIWSSAVVILGLVAVKVSELFPALDWLHKADAAAALVVAGIVVWVCWKLGSQTIHALMDATPAGYTEAVHAAVHALDGVLGCHGIRIRQSGSQYFADLHVALADDISLQQTHVMIEKVEARVREIIPDADVTVRPEPREKKKK